MSQLVRWRCTTLGPSMSYAGVSLVGSRRVVHSYSRLNIQYLPQSRHSNGALVQQVSDCIGLLTTTSRKVCATRNGCLTMWSNTIELLLLTLIRQSTPDSRSPSSWSPCRRRRCWL